MVQSLLGKLAPSGLVVAPALPPAHVRRHADGWRSIVRNIHRRSQSCADGHSEMLAVDTGLDASWIANSARCEQAEVLQLFPISASL